MAQSQARPDPDDDEADVDIEMVSQQRGFRSVAKLKRWLARRLGED